MLNNYIIIFILIYFLATSKNIAAIKPPQMALRSPTEQLGTTTYKKVKAMNENSTGMPFTKKLEGWCV